MIYIKRFESVDDVGDRLIEYFIDLDDKYSNFDIKYNKTQKKYPYDQNHFITMKFGKDEDASQILEDIWLRVRRLRSIGEFDSFTTPGYKKYTRCANIEYWADLPRGMTITGSSIFIGDNELFNYENLVYKISKKAYEERPHVSRDIQSVIRSIEGSLSIREVLLSFVEL
jgi:hypothetical protein